jgi:hypothetical protein
VDKDEDEYDPDLDPQATRRLKMLDKLCASEFAEKGADLALRLSADPSPDVREQACLLLGELSISYLADARFASTLERLADYDANKQLRDALASSAAR